MAGIGLSELRKSSSFGWDEVLLFHGPFNASALGHVPCFGEESTRGAVVYSPALPCECQGRGDNSREKRVGREREREREKKIVNNETVPDWQSRNTATTLIGTCESKRGKNENREDKKKKSNERLQGPAVVYRCFRSMEARRMLQRTHRKRERNRNCGNCSPALRIRTNCTPAIRIIIIGRIVTPS